MLITHCSALLLFLSARSHSSQADADLCTMKPCSSLQTKKATFAAVPAAVISDSECSPPSFPPQLLLCVSKPRAQKSLFHTCREETLQDKSSLDLTCQPRPHKTVSVKYRTFNSINYYLYIETQQETCSFKINNSLHAKLEKCILV